MTNDRLSYILVLIRPGPFTPTKTEMDLIPAVCVGQSPSLLAPPGTLNSTHEAPMAEIAQTAAEAYDRYMAFLGEDRIVAGNWHVEKDGRHLACALGVIGTEIDNPSDCPAQIMPRWLAQMVPWFFDNQSFDDAKDWGARFYAELKRIDGKVPFSVVHDWHANVAAPLAIEVATMRKRATEPHEAVRDLHIRALAGDLASRDEWYAKLRPAYANAYAYANANAYAYAYAYANDDAYAYADAKRRVFKRLADGMVECLARVTSPTF